MNTRHEYQSDKNYVLTTLQGELKREQIAEKIRTRRTLPAKGVPGGVSYQSIGTLATLFGNERDVTGTNEFIFYEDPSYEGKYFQTETTGTALAGATLQLTLTDALHEDSGTKSALMEGLYITNQSTNKSYLITSVDKSVVSAHKFTIKEINGGAISVTANDIFTVEFRPSVEASDAVTGFRRPTVKKSFQCGHIEYSDIWTNFSDIYNVENLVKEDSFNKYFINTEMEAQFMLSNQRFLATSQKGNLISGNPLIDGFYTQIANSGNTFANVPNIDVTFFTTLRKRVENLGMAKSYLIIASTDVLLKFDEYFDVKNNYTFSMQVKSSESNGTFEVSTSWRKFTWAGVDFTLLSEDSINLRKHYGLDTNGYYKGTYFLIPFEQEINVLDFNNARMQVPSWEVIYKLQSDGQKVKASAQGNLLNKSASTVSNGKLKLEGTCGAVIYGLDRFATGTISV